MKKNLLKAYETDASGLKGKALNVVQPQSISEVQGLVKENRHVVARGSGTGLVGGCIPQQGIDVVIDLTALTKIGTFDSERKTIEVQAGVIVEDLLREVRKHKLTFPIDLASKDIATIGGMIATNAAGRRGMRYGKTSNWIQWIDVVDEEGRIQRKGATELSDYCGMEGTTGIIVSACLKLAPIVKRSASVVSIGSLDEVLSITRNLKRDLSVSMIELFDAQTSEWLGFNEGYNIIIEYEDDTGMIKNQEYTNLMALLDKVYEEAYKRGYTRVEDPKLISDRFEKLGLWLDERQVPFFGHLSNGIIHPLFTTDTERHIPEMIKLVRRLGGNMSGTFGIGLLKKHLVDINDKKILTNIKKRTDPLNKFNRGKII